MYQGGGNQVENQQGGNGVAEMGAVVKGRMCVNKTHALRAWASRACCLGAVALHADEPTTMKRSKMMIVGEDVLLVAVERVGVLRLRPWNQACLSRREVFGRCARPS